jgi:hypothetical protein
VGQTDGAHRRLFSATVTEVQNGMALVSNVRTYRRAGTRLVEESPGEELASASVPVARLRKSMADLAEEFLATEPIAGTTSAD